MGQWAAFTGWQLCCGCARAAWQTGFRFWLRKKGVEGGAVVVPSARRAPSPGRCVLATTGAGCAHSCLFCVCLCNCLHDCQSICLCDRETKMLAESSLWKINLGSFPCYVPGTLVLRNYDTAIVASLFCFLRDDLYPGVRNARLLKLSVCDLTSRKWESGWEGRRTWKTVNSLFGLWNETVKRPETGLRLSGFNSRSATYTKCVPWAKSFYSVPKFVHLPDSDSNSAHLIGLWRLNICKTLRTVPDT